MTLDTPAKSVLSRASNDGGTSLDPVSSSCHGRAERRWYCAWTHPNREHQAARELRVLGFEAYLPLHQTRHSTDRRAIVPLFPRYLFIVLYPGSAWGEILRHAGRTTTGAVAGIIRHAPDKPTPLPVGVVERLQARTSARGVVDDPEDPDAPAPPSMPVGAAVRVVGGPISDEGDFHTLAGMEGIVAMSSSSRVYVLLRLLGREVTVSLDARHVAEV